MAVTKEQVNIYMDKRSKGATQAVAAAKAGISDRTARRVDKGDSGAGPKKRRGRNHPDPFAEAWPELRAKLTAESDLQPITLLEIEGIDNEIRIIKRIACGFRDDEHFSSRSELLNP